ISTVDPTAFEVHVDLVNGDLNGDGRPDLVSGQRGVLAFNNGDGTFSLQQLGLGDGPATVGQYDDDRRLDIGAHTVPTMSNSDFHFRVLLNMGYVPQPITVNLPQVGIAGAGAFLNRQLPDGDADGVDTFAEDGAPHHGDGNYDGIPDRQQADVASL